MQQWFNRLIPIGLLFFGLLFTVPAQGQQDIGPPFSEEGSYGAAMAEDVIIQGDPETGSLIIITDDETNEHIEKIIENLDRPIPQVLIKVLFLEVTHGHDFDVGVQWSYQGDDGAHTVETLFGLEFPSFGGHYRILESDFTATLRALEEVSELNVLSRPSILTRHNQEAVIIVGQEVPFIRSSRLTEQNTTINTVEYEDIGIILRVTPYIASNGIVEMDLSPEISTLTGESIQISEGVFAPVFAKRSAETRVVVPNGETVVIGGLMEEQVTDVVTKVPILGSIPLLGKAFQRKTQETTKTELLIFLTPRVMMRTDQLEHMTNHEVDTTRIAPKVYSQETIERYIVAPQPDPLAE